MIGWGYGWDMPCCGYGCRGGIFSWGAGMRAEAGVGEDLAEVGWSVKVDGGGCLKEIVSGGVWEEDMEIFTKDMFEFREVRIVGGDKGIGVPIIGGLRESDGMRKVGTGNLLKANKILHHMEKESTKVWPLPMNNEKISQKIVDTFKSSTHDKWHFGFIDWENMLFKWCCAI